MTWVWIEYLPLNTCVFLDPSFCQMGMLNITLEGYCTYSSPNIHQVNKTVRSSPMSFFLVEESGAEIDFLRHLAVVLLYLVQLTVFSKVLLPSLWTTHQHTHTHTINKHHVLNKLNQKLGQQYSSAGSFLFSAKVPSVSKPPGWPAWSLVFLDLSAIVSKATQIQSDTQSPSWGGPDTSGHTQHDCRGRLASSHVSPN